MSTADNPRVMTDLEVAILRNNCALTISDWDYMTPAQKIAELAESWAARWARADLDFEEFE